MENDDLTLPGGPIGEGAPTDDLSTDLSLEAGPDLGAAPTVDLSADLSLDGELPKLDGELPDLGGGGGLEAPALDMTPGGGEMDLATDALSPDMGMEALSMGDEPGGAMSDMMSGGEELPDVMATAAVSLPEISASVAPIATAAVRGLADDSIVNIGAIHSIKVTVQAVLGGVSMPISQLMSLKKDDVVALDSKIGSAIDLLANGQLIARGEIVVLEEEDEPRFGITLTEIVSGGKT